MPSVKNRATALLLIDIQESFRQRPYFDDRELPAFFDRCRTLIDGFTQAGLPIVRILHVDGDGPFSKASGFAIPMAELVYRPAAHFEKNVHSAMVGTGLQGWLITHGLSRLVVAGIRTEQCCETTTRNASDLGFAVDFVTEATLTFPMTTRAGRVVSADEIRERTELVLADRFATIVTAQEAVERARASMNSPLPLWGRVGEGASEASIESATTTDALRASPHLNLSPEAEGVVRTSR